MSEKGKKLYEDLKKKINRLKEQGTKEKQFADFWRLACTAKYFHNMGKRKKLNI